MQKEFTKADLKDGMVAHLDNGNKTVLVNDYYTTKNDFECVNGRLILKRSGRKVTKVEYGNEVVWEQSNKMIAEEMKAKLEELTGKKIQVESNRRVGQWFLLDECSNSGVYCSICGKKVYKEDYANQKIKSKFCPNCGAIMEC